MPFFIDKFGAKCYYTNIPSMFMERSGEYVPNHKSNADLYVYGHGDADAHDDVCSLAACPNHTGAVPHPLT